MYNGGVIWCAVLHYARRFGVSQGGFLQRWCISSSFARFRPSPLHHLSREEEETPAHPKEEEDASMQHVESGWTLVSGRRRREWVDTHPAHRVPVAVGGKTTESGWTLLCGGRG